MEIRSFAAVVLGLVLASAPGCGEKEAEPVTAARAYASAMQSRDVKALLQLVESDVADRLQQSAARASDHVGGRRNIESHEMLQIVDVSSSFQVASAELVTSDAASAQVQLTGVDGSVHLIDLVAQDGEWRVRIPMPPVSAEGAT